MLQFFRINDPYRLIFIFLILLVFRVTLIILGLPLSVPDLYHLVVGQRLGEGFTMYNELYDNMAPLSALVYKWLDIIFGRTRWIHVILSTLLVIIQAGILNNTLLKNKAYDENTYVPAFLYVVLMCGTIDFFSLSPQLMALTFILLSLNNIFKRIDNIVTDELFLISGLYLGIATFFYFPTIILLIVLLLSLVLFSSAVTRRLLMYTYGASTVFLIILSYFYWNDAWKDFIGSFFWGNLTTPSNSLIGYMTLLEMSYVLIPVGLISLTVIFTQRLTNYQQKIQQVMIMLIIGAIILIVLSRDLTPHELLFFIPSMTFFLTYYLLGIKRRFWKFILPNLFIIGLLAYPVYYYISKESSPLIIEEKGEISFTEERVMGIGVPISIYANNTIAGPFVNDYLSKEKLKGLDYYGPAGDLYDVINTSEATVIVDSLGVIPKVFDRFPQLESQFRKSAKGTYRRVSNN